MHVDPVVVTVPDTLDAEVVAAVDRVRQASQRLDEETLLDATFAGQYEHPRVNTQSVQTVLVRQLQQLSIISTSPPPTHTFS